jgi:hypothetical protein
MTALARIRLRYLTLKLRALCWVLQQLRAGQRGSYRKKDTIERPLHESSGYNHRIGERHIFRNLRGMLDNGRPDHRTPHGGSHRATPTGRR